MSHMYATKKNFRIVEKIIQLFHDEKVSVSQAHAILKYTKSKIAHDTVVGQPIEEDICNLPEDVKKRL